MELKKVKRKEGNDSLLSFSEESFIRTNWPIRQQLLLQFSFLLP